ncbi:GNAT family N-acetyltransferase [Pedobacter caeni]|uniref:Acetyltransferase (GNAT) domain-containing protein n=1 Tax=Pedobacter caeni TaxID=288992 RepID=A0A1M5GFE6_9SPHI|nr:GNAT family N-acetyltransferase [Pedobacter caeni]SHG02465.1 Acetyltransferase (GNAT) domain-containing protein [Pedobacter caeni]
MLYQSFIVREKEQWDVYIRRSRDYEVYHTWYYHSLNKLGEPLLFVYEEAGFFIAFPMIKRSIANSSFYDLTSVYGYAGPVSDLDFAGITENSLKHFKDEFCRFLTEERFVSAFTRLYPFLNQQYVLENIGGIFPNGSTIYMDLSISVEEQRSRYEKRLKRQVKKLRESNYTIKDTHSREDISLFTEMYHKNMDRLNAHQSYYFDEAYFTGLLNQEEFENRLVLIYDGTELICGALVLISEHVVRNHLSATSEKYLKQSPSKLLTDEISMIGRRLGKKIFHLGGGVGGKEDSLFMFKRHFSDLQVSDRIWCYINDQQVYQELVLLRGAGINPDSAFFPAYRQ